MTDLLRCPASGTLVDADSTDGDGVLRRTCSCGSVVCTTEGPTTGLRYIERHRPKTIAGQLGQAEHLLARVAEGMAPVPGGLVRVVLPAYTAERIKAVVDERTAEMYRRVPDHMSLPVEGEPW